jgi:CarD family transcriptional regulator
LKTKSTGPKSTNAKSSSVKSPKAKTSAKVAKKSIKPVAKTKSSVVALTAVKTTRTAVVVAKAKTAVVQKVSVTERISASKLVKTSSEVVALKTSKAKLSLVAKADAKVPATKISRSEPHQPGSKVITGKFGVDAAVVTKPVIALKPQEKPTAPVITVGEVINFKSGDKIVYPGHGVGEVEGIRTTVLGGQEHHIYNIKILDSGMKVMVPVSQAAAVGLRRIIDKKAIDEVFSILKDRDFKIDTQTWNRRFREYSQKIKTGSVFEIAIVLRDLSVLSADKELSFGEKKMLDMAETLLVSEIAIAKARPHDKVVGELRALFA